MARKANLLLRLGFHLLFLRPWLHLVFGLTKRGAENLPSHGPFVLAANHNSHLDIIMLCSALPLRLLADVHVVAALDYFAPHKGLFSFLDWLFRPVWVDRDASGDDVLERMAEVVDAGEILIIFPEGTRGKAGELCRFHTGVGRLMARRPGTPLLPAFIFGSERALPREVSLPLPIWHHVKIGPPQLVSGDAGDITLDLRESVVALGRSYATVHQRRSMEKQRTFVVAVLGIDGSGKSTLSRLLAEQYSHEQSTCLIGDELKFYAGGAPRKLQPLLKDKLRKWLSAQAKDARSLARYKVPKISELLLRDALLGEVQRWYGPDIVISDGSPLLNMTAWSALYHPELMSPGFCAQTIRILSGQDKPDDPLYGELPELRAMKRLGLTRLRLPDAVIFLDVPPAVSMERILLRGEDVQVHENPEKLGRLRAAYLQVVQALSEQLELPAHVLDGERGQMTIRDEARSLIDAIRGEEGEAQT